MASALRIERKCSFTIMVRPAKDVPGQWLAHCLDFDVIAQGENPEHAMKMMIEVIDLSISDDFKVGLDPWNTRKSAPKEYWNEWLRVTQTGERIAVADTRAGTFQRLAAMLIVDIVIETIDHVHTAESVVPFGIPPAWMIEQFDRISSRPTYK